MLTEKSEVRLSLEANTAKVRAMLDTNWRQPLEAAARTGKPAAGELVLHTAWEKLPGPDAAFQHAAYASEVRRAMDREMPGLADMLRDAEAHVIVWFGCFLFGLPKSNPAGAWLVDEMTPHTMMIPWVTQEEEATPQ